jgi:hypothetical protein
MHSKLIILTIFKTWWTRL